MTITALLNVATQELRQAGLQHLAAELRRGEEEEFAIGDRKPCQDAILILRRLDVLDVLLKKKAAPGAAEALRRLRVAATRSIEAHKGPTQVRSALPELETHFLP